MKTVQFILMYLFYNLYIFDSVRENIYGISVYLTFNVKLLSSKFQIYIYQITIKDINLEEIFFIYT